MAEEAIETVLTSTEQTGSDNLEVTLRIIARFQTSDSDEEISLSFYCDPLGTNYRSSFLQVSIGDWSTVRELRGFLVDCFSEEILDRRARTFAVKDGVQSITPWNKPPREVEGLDEITVQVDGGRVEFQQSGTVLPYIFTFEKRAKDGTADEKNAEKLIDFFEKVIKLDPEVHQSGFDSRGGRVGGFIGQVRVEDLLRGIPPSHRSPIDDYQKGVQEFEDREYEDSIRDLGRAAESLIEVLCLELYDRDEIPENMAARLNKLDKSESGLPSYIAKSIAPIWWLRNKVAHPNSHHLDEADALYALYSFRIATTTLIEDYLD